MSSCKILYIDIGWDRVGVGWVWEGGVTEPAGMSLVGLEKG